MREVRNAQHTHLIGQLVELIRSGAGKLLETLCTRAKDEAVIRTEVLGRCHPLVAGVCPKARAGRSVYRDQSGHVPFGALVEGLEGGAITVKAVKQRPVETLQVLWQCGLEQTANAAKAG